MTRYDNTAAPDWPAARVGTPAATASRSTARSRSTATSTSSGTGRPPNRRWASPTSSAQLGAYLMTTSPAINAIPYLCRAEPGLYGSMDLDRGRNLHVLRGV